MRELKASRKYETKLHTKGATGKCPSNKRRFKDREQAKDALFGARTRRHLAAVDGVHSNRNESRTYFCSRCKGWHLTSQELRSAA